ncbi:MAG TPA: 7TM diverse intracellular signaling domain-containing protein, partial [Thermoanaerobaculia bacterium]|nr:7TM diverse intracellular signaling domain-containing protein [Thermoanaerobaculia bacterium]
MESLQTLRIAKLVLAVLLLPVSLRAEWAMHKGDDARWARPDFDDSAWPRASVLSTWREQGLRNYDGVVWYRGVVRVDGDGLLLGPPVYGGYEAYADGRLIGRSRGWSTALPFAVPEVFRVPRDAVRGDGTVRIALRARRIGWASDLDPDSGPVSATLTPGAYAALLDRVSVRWMHHLMSELPLLVLAVLFVLVGLHHFLLYARGRKQGEHLWFGCFALAFALNTFASTYWIYEITGSRGIAARTSDMTGHLAAAFAIQFLWTFFGRRMSRVVRGYQLSHVALAAFVTLWPDDRL